MLPRTTGWGDMILGMLYSFWWSFSLDLHLNHWEKIYIPIIIGSKYKLNWKICLFILIILKFSFTDLYHKYIYTEEEIHYLIVKSLFATCPVSWQIWHGRSKVNMPQCTRRGEEEGGGLKFYNKTISFDPICSNAVTNGLNIGLTFGWNWTLIRRIFLWLTWWLWFFV